MGEAGMSAGASWEDWGELTEKIFLHNQKELLSRSLMLAWGVKELGV